jgi:hypothetical protein
MEIIMTEDISSVSTWGDYGKDWVWENDVAPKDWEDWSLEEEWVWEDQEVEEDWGQEGVDWEWYEEYY